MAKGEIPDGPKDDYRDGLREKNGMRCEHLPPSLPPSPPSPFSLLKYDTLSPFLDFYLQFNGEVSLALSFSPR